MRHRVSQLGYLRLSSTQPAKWSELATLVGFGAVDSAGSLFLRLDDDRAWRLQVCAGDTDELTQLGWEVADRPAFDAVVERLEAAGCVPVDRPDLARERGTQALATFSEPDGREAELYWGMRTMLRERFVSPQQVRFQAGSSGLGHVTMAVRDVVRSRDFYLDVLGMEVTEVADVAGGEVVFLRCNERHHTLALAQLPSRASRVLHIMVEVATLDDLGAIRDRLVDAAVPIANDLGRHPTDGVISLYVETPATFDLEVGWGSIPVDAATWASVRYQRAGWSWGHRRPGTSGSEGRLGDLRGVS